MKNLLLPANTWLTNLNLLPGNFGWNNTTGGNNKPPTHAKSVLLLIACLLFTLFTSGVFGQSITNYSFAASSSTFTTLLSPVNPAISGGDTDDGYFNTIPIGFDFWYMGNRYTTISASTNGWFTFGGNITDPVYLNNLSAGGSPRPVVAALWDDIDIVANANFSYKTAGSIGSRTFTLQWLNCKWDYTASSARISIQAKLYEGTGKIEFIYQQVGSSAPVSPSASIGIAAIGTGAGNYLSLNNASATPTANSTTETNTISTRPANGQLYSFAPLIPAAATGLTFSAVGNTTMTLNWTDNAVNEKGYVIYVSSDGGATYAFANQLAANATSSVQTGLAANITYYWKVYAVSEGGLSAALTGSQLTGCTQPPVPGVTSPINYCKDAVASPLSATGSNLLWTIGGSGAVGGTSTLTNTTYVDNNYNNKRTNFTTTDPNITISKVDYYIPAWQTVNGLVLGIYNNAGTLLATSGTATTQTAGASAVKITATFNYILPASGNYSVGVSSGTGNIGSDNPSFPLTESTGTISITGVTTSGYRCFNNIVFSGTVSATPPTPLTSGAGTTNYYVTQTVGGCVSQPATITVNVNFPSTSQVSSLSRIAYYRLDGDAADVDNNNNGTLQNAPVLVADRFGVANKAYSFNGSSQYISTANAYTAPSEFTISSWFKTSTTNGGKLIGFALAQTGQSSQYDRHIYMNNAGQLYFGVYPGSVHTVNSTLSYNDGNWHMATATLSPSAGMALYVDGAQVASDPTTTTAENFTGYWRIGYDNMNGWTSQPSVFYFNGGIDEVLIYSRALSATEINTLFTSPSGAGNNGPVCVGSSLTLSANSIAGATYSWSGPGAFSSSLQNPSFIYNSSNAGTYNLQVTVAGCSVMAYTNVISSANAGQWTGNVSTDWATAGNWCNGIVPSASTNVVIATGAARMPVITSSVSCNNLVINPGATVTTSIAGTLNVSGTLTNNGTMVNNGTTVFSGSVQQSFSGVNSFYNLTVNNAAGLILPAAINVNNNLTIAAGILNSNNFAISVGGNWVNNVSGSAFTGGTSTVTLNGSAVQSLGGTSATTFNNLVIANTSNIVSLAANATITGNLSINSGTLDLGNYTANRSTTGGVLTVANNATLKIGGTNTFPANYTTNTLVVASTVEYSGTNQVVSNKVYGNLKLSSSSGAAVKTFPATALSVVGDLISVQGAGSSVSFSAASNITISGNVSIGASTTFNGGSYSHTIGASWLNNGIYNGNTGTLIFTGAGSTVNGVGAQNFNNLTLAAALISFSANLGLSGNLATTGSGTFSQAAGGTLTMTGTGKTIAGSGISIENLAITGSVSTAISLTITGNLSGSGSFAASAGTITMSGVSKSISGAGTKGFNILSVTGSLSTDANFSVASGMVVGGSFIATAGTATFTGTSTLSGTANFYNVNVNGTSLQLSANSIMGIASQLTISSGTLNTTSSTPNTVNFNGTGAQAINTLTYDNLMLSNGSTKTASAGITIKNSITIGAGTTFIPGSYTHSVYVDWNNYGNFTAGSSTIQFLGNQNTNINGVTSFNVLTINNSNSATGIHLNNNISAATVNMTLGTLYTNSDTITITGTRNGNGIIIGNIRRTHSFTTGVAYVFESPYNTINFSAVSGVTSITVSVTQGPISDYPYAVRRLYNISVPSGSYNATLRLHYEDAELNANPESVMGMWNYNALSEGWIPIGKSGNSTSLNYLEQTGLTSITNRWACSFTPNVIRWNGSVSSDWNTPANWTTVIGTPTVPPSSADVVTLGDASFINQPVISNAVTVKNIVFGSVKAVNLSLATGGSLNSGDIFGAWNTNLVHTLNVNNQALNINGGLMLGDSVMGHAINLNIGSGTVNISGSLEETSGANINFTGNGNLNISGNFIYNSGTFNAGSGTVSYNGTDNQDLAKVNYNNLTINKQTGIADIDSTVYISGNLQVSSGELHNYSLMAIGGNVTIAATATLYNHNVIRVGGNWNNNGVYNSSSAGTNVVFNGTGTQTISASTFNNLEFNKPVGTVAELTGDVILKGNLVGTSGTLDIKSYFFNRDIYGGTATMADAATLIIAADNAPNKFSGYYLAPNSTVIFNGTGTQHLALPGVTYGNLIFRNSGTKILYTGITVTRKLLIENTAVFDAGSNIINLDGDWQNNGTFIPSSSTVVCGGANKTVSGATTFNKVTITGSYTNLSNITYNDLLHITASGSISSGTGIFTTMNGDLVNNGVLYTLGTTTFTGNVQQTLSLINAVQTVALIVNFNGSIPPVLNSTSNPQFGYLNINNTGGVNPSVGWTILYSLTVGNGASFNAGTSTHNILGSLTNNGVITSSGILNFTPSTSVTLDFGNNFTSTGRVNFAGSGAITLAGNPVSFYDVHTSNTNTAGLAPVSGWNVLNNFTVNTGSVFKAGSQSYSIGGNILNSGIINSGTSTFTLSGTGIQTVQSGSAFNNLTNNKTAGITTLASDISLNGILNFALGNIETGNYKVTIASSGSVTGASAITGWVNGKLQKYIANGAPVKIFETGDGANYAPVTVSFDQVSSAGFFTVSTTAGDHPQVSNSTINPGRSVNRYWTILNTGTVYTHYKAGFIFVSADVDAGTSAALLGVSNHNGSGWSVITEDSATSTSIKALHVTSTGDFAVGEICNKNTSINYAGTPYCASSTVANVTLTGNTGGIFSANTGLAINSSTGLVDIGVSVPGTYLVSYKIDATGGCPTFVTGTAITINPVPNATISYPGSPYCANGGSGFVNFAGTTGGMYTSSTGLSINALTGEINISASSLGSYTVTYSIGASNGCAGFSTSATVAIVPPGTWTGAVNNDWDNASNWLCGAIPNATTNVIIPAGLPVYPLITTVKSLNNLSIVNGGSLTVASGTLQVAGVINNAGILDVSAGTIEFNGVAPQTIAANSFKNNTIMNIIISNNVSLAGEDTLTGTLYFGRSNKTFSTNDFLTFKSTALGTARIDDITNAGNSSGNSITGKINIERYIPLRKAWRLLSAPVKSATAPTIHDAWQEGVTNVSVQPNPHPGYGVHITGGTVINGFDQSSNNAASVKVYNNSTNSFIALPPIPGTNRPLTDYPGYFVYIRGDRSINLSQGASAAITSTTLRMKGELRTGVQQVNVNAANYTLLGNPYASAINFQSLGLTNVKNSFYRWDPMLSGNYGLGAYVAFIWNNETGTYDATTSASHLTQYIPSGEAIVVQSADGVNAGRIDIRETDKTANGGGQSFNRPSGSQQQLRVDMYLVNADSSVSLMDGTLTTYSVRNNNDVDLDDAKKMYGSNESINLKRGGTALAIERRKTVVDADTSFLNIYQMKQQNYRLQINVTNMDHNGLTAVLKDSYASTNDELPLNLNGNTFVNFVVNADPASFNVNRFSIVFKPLTALPVTFRTVKAYRREKDIAVEWLTENEVNINHYEVERSADGSNFSNIHTTAATVNSTASSYLFPDTDPLEGVNYYRIRSVSNDGGASYSSIVKVSMEKENQQAGIHVYPNPVLGNTISFNLSDVDAGIYNLQLYNKMGQLVASKKIEHRGGNGSMNIEVKDTFSTGKYELRLTGTKLTIITSVLKK